MEERVDIFTQLTSCSPDCSMLSHKGYTLSLLLHPHSMLRKKIRQ